MKHLSGLIVTGVLVIVTQVAVANPVSESLEYDVTLNDDGTSITASYLSIRNPNEDGSTIVEVEKDGDWVKVSDDWMFDEGVTVANGGSGDMDYHEVSTVVACPAAGTQKFRVSDVYEHKGEIEIYDLFTASVECAASGVESFDDSSAGCSFTAVSSHGALYSLLRLVVSLW
jgi:hypothetical protein